jgi:hypothetical protein
MYPAIIIGMHRSGTSLLSRIVESLGIHQGVKKDRNNESVVFGALNDWLLRTNGARSDFPAPFDYQLSDQPTRALIKDYLQRVLRGPYAIQYLGLQNYLRYRGITGILDIPWGWKDPRNTITLPIWLEQFPSAKVLYIERHGVDVADSFRKRRVLAFQRSRETYHRTKGRYRFFRKRSGFAGSLKCMTLEGSFSVWEDYVRRGRAAIQQVGPNRGLAIKYEELLSNPREEVGRLVRFLNLSPSPAKIDEIASGFNPERLFAFKHSPELVRFAATVQHRLLGYETAAQVHTESHQAHVA